ncbi:sensor histidine kinase [bacterium 1xD8-6]|jgi:Signal transduction histidine kinase|nr:sensor histidine kinase [bacterium D16-36]RKI67756.1 sensor histidine kinase [bacterium 1xD8-6]
MGYFLQVTGGCLLFAAVLFLGLRLHHVKRQVKQISGQLEHSVYHMVSVDLSDRKIVGLAANINCLIEHMQQIKAEAGKKESSLKSAIAVVSHDMKTPLTSVIGYLQLAEKSCRDKGTMENLSIALERAEYCNKLMNDFFELAVVDTDEYCVKLEPVDVSELLCEQILANYPNFEQKGITPVFRQGDQKIYAMADRQMLIRVVQNLISNSIKYSNEKVSFAINTKDDIMLTVSNPVSEQIDTEQIFDRFYQSEQSRRGDGMGLGLYICDKFIRRMGGTILAECQDGRLDIIITLEKRGSYGESKAY